MLRNFLETSSKNPGGITLLLVILVLSALLSVSVGIFNSTFTELRISGELANSFQAMYAADQMLELALYKDRVLGATCTSLGENCYTDTQSFANGSCATAAVSKIGGVTYVKSIGQFDCAPGSLRTVKRSFQVAYGGEDVPPQYAPADQLVRKAGTVPGSPHSLACASGNGNNLLYCFGGHTTMTQIARYDPVADSMSAVQTLPAGRLGMSCVLNKGDSKIYCFGGGQDGSYFTNSNAIYFYDPLTNLSGTVSAVLPHNLGMLACAPNSSTNLIYCFGGFDGYVSGIYNEIYEYNPANDTLVTKSAVLPSSRYYHSCAENPATHKIYCFGGVAGGAPTNQIIEYNPASDSVAVVPATLPANRLGLSCAANTAINRIYCFGGIPDGGGGSPTNQITEFIPATQTLSVKTSVSTESLYVMGCAENNATHRIYCFAGAGQGAAHNGIDEYTSSTP